MKKILLALVFLLCGNVFAADEWRRGYVYNPASASGADIWFGPGGTIESGTAARGRTTWSQGTGGVNAVETGAVALRDGRSVALTATRKITTSAVLGGVLQFANSPAGVVAALAIPFVIDWIAGDNEEHIRINPSATGVEIREVNPTLCTVAPCYEYRYHTLQQWFVDSAAACSNFPIAYNGIGSTSITLKNPYLVGTGCHVENWQYGSLQYSEVVVRQQSPRVPDNEPGWLPSSLNDIAPYLTPRVPSAALVPYLLEKGITFPAEEVSITGPSPALAPVAPHVRSTQYPAPAPTTETSTVPGNPFNLAPSTPTVTGTNQGTKTVSPGSSSSTGPVPTPAPPSPKSIDSPTTSTTTSTYNPTTNQTTNVTNTTVAPQTVTQTTNTVTNITNTSNSSTVSNSTTTVTTVTNNITNTTITTTETADPQSPEPTRSDCDINPDSIGCQSIDFDTPTDEIPKTTKTITYAAEDLGFAGGSCPSNLTMTIDSGQTITVGDWTKACNMASTYAKPMILVMATFAAMMILFGFGRSEL